MPTDTNPPLQTRLALQQQIIKLEEETPRLRQRVHELQERYLELIEDGEVISEKVRIRIWGFSEWLDEITLRLCAFYWSLVG